MVSEEPFRERRWALLMLALYRSGRQVDALRALQRLRAKLAEVGLQPGPQVLALERQISAHAEATTAQMTHPPSPATPTATMPTLQTVPGNLPLPATSFVGRSVAVKELANRYEHIGC